MTAVSDPRQLQLHLDLRRRSPRRKSSISRQRKERTDMLANDGALLRGNKTDISNKAICVLVAKTSGERASVWLNYIKVSPFSLIFELSYPKQLCEPDRTNASLLLKQYSIARDQALFYMLSNPHTCTYMLSNPHTCTSVCCTICPVEREN